MDEAARKARLSPDATRGAEQAFSSSRRDTVCMARSSPGMKCSIDLAIHRQIRTLVRKPAGQRLVDVDAKTRFVPGMHDAVLERVRVRKHSVGLFGVAHIFLNAEVVDAQIEV